MQLPNNKYHTIEKLRFELKNPLPGFEAQRLMLPITRQGNKIEVPDNAKKGAVLILLYEKEGNLTVCFMKRTVDGSVHGGQISLPGGRKEDFDKDLIYTALRETEEELGTEKRKHEVLGILSPLYIPVSNYEVLPVVAFSKNSPAFKINKHEVDELIEVEVDTLLKPDTCKLDKVSVNNLEYEVPVYKVGEHKIWGATAMIMSEFIQIYKCINCKTS